MSDKSLAENLRFTGAPPDGDWWIRGEWQSGVTHWAVLPSPPAALAETPAAPEVKVMDSRLREILEKHEYRHSTDYEMSYCSCGVDTPGREAWLDHIESLESQQPNTRGKGMEHFPVPDDAEQAILPPQRSMTPEESANLAAYHKTKFKRVSAQGDQDRPFPAICNCAYIAGNVNRGHADWCRLTLAYKTREWLAAHDAALRASVREELLKQGFISAVWHM